MKEKAEDIHVYKQDVPKVSVQLKKNITKK